MLRIQAGIKAGDFIIAVNGVDTKHLLGEMIGVMRGQPGTRSPYCEAQSHRRLEPVTLTECLMLTMRQRNNSQQRMLPSAAWCWPFRSRGPRRGPRRESAVD